MGTVSFKEPSTPPPGGYEFFVPGLDKPFRSFNLALLLNQLEEYHTANNIPGGDRATLWAELQRQHCERNPDICRDDDGGRSIKKMMGDFLTGVTTWAIRDHCAKVSQEVFDKRVSTCLKCDKWKGWQQSGVGYCGQCGCPVGRLSLKLYMPSQQCPLAKWLAVPA